MVTVPSSLGLCSLSLKELSHSVLEFYIKPKIKIKKAKSKQFGGKEKNKKVIY